MSKKAKATCRGCDAKVKRSDMACRQCGAAVAAAPGGNAAAKVFASGGTLYKSTGSNVVPIGSAVRKGVRKSSRPRCWTGCGPSRPGAAYCSGCGEPYGISYGDHVERAFKSAWMPPVPGWGDWRDEPDSKRAEQIRDMQAAQLRATGQETAWLAKAAGGLHAAWESEPDAVRADILWRAMHPGTYPSGGNIA